MTPQAQPPALAWRLKCWTRRRPINGWASCCPQLVQAHGNTILTTDPKCGPCISFSQTDSFGQTDFNGISFKFFWCHDYTAQFLQMILPKLDVHCRKLLRRAAGPRAIHYFKHGTTGFFVVFLFFFRDWVFEIINTCPQGRVGETESSG